MKRLIKKILAALDSEDVVLAGAIVTGAAKMPADPSARLDRLVSLARLHPATSARLLRAANTLFASPGNSAKIDQVREAIARIGPRASEELILGSALSSLLKNDLQVEDFTSGDLWKHCVAVATGARLIQEARSEVGAGDAFLAGLLHDIGIAIEHVFLAGDGFQDAVVMRHRRQGLLADAESWVWRFSHQDVGETVARKWQMPEHIVAVIARHHGPRIDSSRHADLIHTVRLAESISFVRGMGYSDFSAAQAEEMAASRDVLGLDERSLAGVEEALVKEMRVPVELSLFPSLRLKRTWPGDASSRWK